MTLYHFPKIGLYVYASTKSILDNALKKVKLNDKHCEVDISEGEILEINSAGNLSRSTFTMQDYIHICSTRTIGINWIRKMVDGR